RAESDSGAGAVHAVGPARSGPGWAAAAVTLGAVVGAGGWATGGAVGSSVGPLVGAVGDGSLEGSLVAGVVGGGVGSVSPTAGLERTNVARDAARIWAITVLGLMMVPPTETRIWQSGVR